MSIDLLHMPKNPWTMVALGALAGMWVASHRKRQSTEPPGVVTGVIGAAVLHVVRELALHHMTKIATTIVKPTEMPPSSPYAS